MRSINISEAAQKLPDLIDAALRGEEVIITKDDLSVVKIIPVTPVKRYPAKAGSAKGLVWMSDDFDEPLEDFKEYME
ncbi:MAG: type II toxin-antitoxin system Phd/YefM family antitoxin [Hydrococcus sp. RU_2_2]|jgi:prevent-host-death family protein|nr:type II toxin-antitoxin system Phd/YefM family antitoxin [Hydrococcus sp. RU_2_2]NJP22555.1 type II toxin-antitoxin system Phd/YefM family antitoxin [Hydrococcus sp. CRU_1_1]